MRLAPLPCLAPRLYFWLLLSAGAVLALQGGQQGQNRARVWTKEALQSSLTKISPSTFGEKFFLSICSFVHDSQQFLESQERDRTLVAWFILRASAQIDPVKKKAWLQSWENALTKSYYYLFCINATLVLGIIYLHRALLMKVRRLIIAPMLIYWLGRLKRLYKRLASSSQAPAQAVNKRDEPQEDEEETPLPPLDEQEPLEEAKEEESHEHDREPKEHHPPLDHRQAAPSSPEPITLMEEEPL